MKKNRRRYLASIGAGATLAAAGCLGGDETPEDSEPSTSEGDTDGAGGHFDDGETITVEDSIQAAVDESSPGDTVSIPAGVYEEFVRVGSDRRIVAEEDVVLDGRNITPEDGADPAFGFDIDADSVRLAGVEIVGYQDAAVGTTTSASSVTLEDILVEGGNDGVSLEATNIEITDSTISDTDGNGADLTSDRTGEVTVTECDVQDCSGRGIGVVGGKSIAITDVTVAGNDRGIEVSGGNARDQEVTVSGVRATSNGRGIVLKGADGDASRSIEGTEVLDGGGGVSITGDRITVSDTLVSGPSLGVTHRAAVMLASTPDGTVSVTDVEVEDVGASSSNDKAGRGIAIVDGGDVTISDVSITRAYGNVIHLETEDARDRTASITDAEIIDSGESSAIQVDSAGGDDSVTLERIRTADTVRGIEIHCDTVSGHDIEVDGVAGNGSPGVAIESGPNGTVDLETVSVSDAPGRSSYSPYGRGIEIVNAETVTVTDATLTRNYGDNLFVEANEARDQMVKIEDVTAETNSAGSGIVVTGSGGDDDVEIVGTASRDHRQYGFDIGGTSVTLRGCTASENGNGALNLRDIDESEANITDSNFA